MSRRKLINSSVGRKFYVLDIENMRGNFDGHITAGEVARIRNEVERILPVENMDQVVIGTSCPMNLLAAGAWKGARQVFHGGHDGADVVLLDVLNEENAASRFSSVVLGSGDHIFAQAAGRLRKLGCNVILLDTGTPISHLLKKSVTEIVRMPRTTTIPDMIHRLTAAA